MNRIALISLVPVLAGSLVAQSNTVPGLNGRLTVIDSFSYQGRRGAAHPNGEVAFSMYNEMCNPGTVGIPWAAAMQPNHPKFGFIAVREANGRIEQISDWSYCKHAFVSTNYSGPCGTCNTPGGSVMGVNCADAYGVGNNNDRQWLGPPAELDPWLGTWNPIGSYFDQGDPNVGSPQNNDGIRSPHYAGSDPVKNRVIIRESELLVPGARFFYGIHLMHQGEAVANRGDNLASRGFNPVWNGSTWSSSNNAVAQVYGSVLQHWTGATLNSGGNGNDDGRFFVAVKVTPLGGGQYHYQYAVHNADNHRGGATLRVPCIASATVTNFTFRDIDYNALNEWIGVRVGNEIVFTAPAGNPLNWNTIYNFGFDCDVPPANGAVILDEARLGPGSPSVTVPSQAPGGGLPIAGVNNVGTGCGGTSGCYNSFYEESFDLSNSGFTMTPTASGYTVGTATNTWIAPAGTTVTLGDDAGTLRTIPFAFPSYGTTTSSLWICSNGFVSTSGNNTSYTPGSGPFLSGQRTWAALWRDLDPSAGGSIRLDATASRVVISFVAVPHFGGGGTVTFQWQFYPSGVVTVLYQNCFAVGGEFVGFSRGQGAPDPGGMDISAALPAGFALCSSVVGSTPALAFNAATRPIIGTTVSLVTTNIPAGSVFGAVMLSLQQATPPINLASSGMPGCFRHVVNEVTKLNIPSGASHSYAFAIPNDPTLSGVVVVGQAFTYSPPQTPLGVIASNGVVMVVGQV